MDGNSSEGIKSSPHDFIEDIQESGLSLEKELYSVKGLNSVKDIIKDSVIDKDSRLFSKTENTASLISLASESRLVKERTSVNNSIAGSSQPKSQITSLKLSSDRCNNTVSSQILSRKSELDRPSSTYKPTTISSKHTYSDEVSKISSKNINCDQKDVKHVTKEPSLSYISPCAKSLSRSCDITFSQSSIKTDETKDDFNLKCIPPWAKSLRKAYGMTCSGPNEEMSQQNLQEKIKNLMEKHSQLMLVKRGESRKQLIIKPSERGDMGTVKMTSKNTRYYMTPIPKEVGPLIEGGKTSASSLTNISENLIQDSDDMIMTKKTSRNKAKTEVSSVLKSLYNSKRQNREMVKESHKSRQEQIKCPTITPSQVREFVKAQTLDTDQTKLHEIIKIKKVPSHNDQVGRKSSSKYIINVPKCTKGDGTTVNKITVKEKRKLRIHSVEDINENITEVVYNKCDSKTQEKVKSGYTTEQNVEHDVVPYSKRRKSPTKSRTLEVTAESTPVITDLLKKEEKGRDKILLIQYEEKSKPCKGKPESEKPTLVSTQLFGIKQPCNETLKEMYLYGTETDGKKCKENITQVDDESPTLREKVNMIFQELREMTFKPCAEIESIGELSPSVSSKTVQHPSVLVQTDTVSVQALPEVRSAEVQVSDSVLLSPHSTELIVPQSTPTSYTSEKKSSDIVGDKLTDIINEITTKSEQKTRSQVDSKHPTAEPIKEGMEEVSKIDETEPSELDETESQKSKHSLEENETEEKVQYLDGNEDDELRSITEIDKSDIKPTQDDDQKEIIPGDLQEEIISDDRQEDITLDTGNEKSEDRVIEEQETEDEQKFKKEKYSEDRGSTGDAHSKEFEEIDEIKGDKREEEGKYIEDGEEYDEMLDKNKPWSSQAKIFAEDIRSYEFDPSQDYELKMVSSSKFFHKRDSLRKLNWTDDMLYLEKHTCPQLVKGLAEIAVKQPKDPISYLAHWIYKDYHNRESEEQNSIFKEHLEVTKGTLNTKEDDKLVCKKFNIRRYPIKSHSPTVSNTSETNLVNEENEAEELAAEESGADELGTED